MPLEGYRYRTCSPLSMMSDAMSGQQKWPHFLILTTKIPEMENRRFYTQLFHFHFVILPDASHARPWPMAALDYLTASASGEGVKKGQHRSARLY